MLQAVMNGRARKPQVDKLVEFLKSKSEGDTIGHDAIAKLIGEKRGTTAYFQVVGKARRRILGEFGYALDTLHGEGYRLAPGQDQIRIGVDTTRRGVKQIGKGKRIVEVIDDARLDDTGKKARDFVAGRLYMFEQAIRKEANALRLVVGKTPTLPAMT